MAYFNHPRRFELTSTAELREKLTYCYHLQCVDSAGSCLNPKEHREQIEADIATMEAELELREAE